ncbi:hypothetical protein BHE74_00034326 [Ensete ventricosum]|nr:hypothetical protein BHE74_00034326 [Ensete ventricosum]
MCSCYIFAVKAARKGAATYWQASCKGGHPQLGHLQERPTATRADYEHSPPATPADPVGCRPRATTSIHPLGQQPLVSRTTVGNVRHTTCAGVTVGSV